MKKTHKIIIALSVIGFVLLKYRIHVTHSYFYLFLVWNLFLALVPLAFTEYLQTKQFDKYILLLLSVPWLLLLPNAPYILTDFIHLSKASKMSFWYDFLLIGTFTLAGMLAYFLSLNQMIALFRIYYTEKILNIAVLIIAFLNGFGIYLGRFSRWNSWDILHRPISLFNEILQYLAHPIMHQNVWLFTFLFGVLLSFGRIIFSSLKVTK